MANGISDRRLAGHETHQGTPALRALPEQLRRAGSDHGIGLIITASLYLVALITMLMLIVVAAPPAQLQGNAEELRSRFAVYRFSFVAASLLAPTLISTLILLVAARIDGHVTLRDLVGIVLLPAYLTLSTIAYTSQYALLPRLMQRDAAIAANWYFHDVNSVPYMLDLAGYTIFGLAAVVLARGFLAAGGLWSWIGGLLLSSGLASVAAFGLFAAGWDAIASVFTIASAALTVPLVGLAVFMGSRLRFGIFRAKH